MIQEEGKLLYVNRQGAEEGLSLSVGRFVHQAIKKVHMVHDDKASCTTRQQIDVDWLLAKKNADAFIWHDNPFAYVVAFTEQDVCKKIRQKAQARLGIMVDSNLREYVY
jgi:ABC-type lipopolysaccharide export system ATPase subunit